MLKTFALSPALFGLALAVNDWSKPCTNGACSYETGDGVNTAWSAIDLRASTNALSDITSAAGWKITGCSSTWASGVADIQLSCQGTAEQMALCSHLFDGGVATNKVVRLPEDCGVGPFARVVSTKEIGTNQFDVSLDYEFSKIPSNSAEFLTFTISSSNVKGGVSDGTPLRARRDLPERRYPVALARRFDISKTVDLPPVQFNKAFSLVNQTFDCPAADGGIGASASVAIGAHVNLDARMAFGVSLSGSVLPLPKVDSLQLTGTLTGSAGATVDVNAGVTGSFTTGDITLFKAGLPGLNFPGILNIGPQFQLNTRLDAALGLQANVRAGATYQFPNVQLVFPPSAGMSAAHISPLPDALGLSLEPGVNADASATAHLIPRLEFGLEVLNGLAEASIFLNVDGSAKLEASAQASAVISPGNPIDTSVGGCVGLNAGVAVTAGAVGSIPPIFSQDVSFDIFKRDFELFQKCFGDGASQKREVHGGLVQRKLSESSVVSGSPSQMSKMDSRALACPSPGKGGLLTNVLNLVRQ